MICWANKIKYWMRKKKSTSASCTVILLLFAFALMNNYSKNLCWFSVKSCSSSTAFALHKNVLHLVVIRSWALEPQPACFLRARWKRANAPLVAKILGATAGSSVRRKSFQFGRVTRINKITREFIIALEVLLIGTAFSKTAVNEWGWKEEFSKHLKLPSNLAQTWTEIVSLLHWESRRQPGDNSFVFVR